MKRFTATEKWDNPWYRRLPLVYKLFWQYILDKCDNAGIWRVDFDHASYNVGETVDPGKALALMGDKIKVFDGGEKWWIRPFINYQCGEITTDTKSKPQRNVLTLMRQHGLEGDYFSNSIGYPKGTHTSQEKEKEKEKEKEQEKKEEMGEVEPIIDAWCEAHPNKRRPKRTDGKKGSYAKILARLRAGRTPEEIIKAIKGNANDDWHQKVNKHELSYICQSCDRLDQMIAKHDAQQPKKPPNPLPWLHFTDALRNCPDCIPEAERRRGASFRTVTPTSPRDELEAWVKTIHQVRDENPSM